MKNLFFFAVVSVMSFILLSCDKTYYIYGDGKDDTEQTDNPDNSQGSGGDDKGQTGGGEFATGDYVDVKTFCNKSISVQIWVRGYIVGAATGANGSIRYEYEPPFSYDTALLLADTPSPSETDDIMSVCLTSGSKSLREKLNLAARPENKGQLIEVFGYRERYLDVPGIKHIDGYTFPVK